MLDNANSVTIHNSELISADIVTHNHFHHNPDVLEKLRGHVVYGALFNSAERYDPPKCHPYTRVAVLDSINRWAQGDLTPHKPVLWLRGGAGAGKSAIAQTMSERWSKSKDLAASFYFSRTAPGRNENKHIIATIAYQLIESIPRTRRYIEHALSEHQDLFHTSLRRQFMTLMFNPLMAPSTDIISHKVVVIDGLDECCFEYPDQNYEAQQRDILKIITLAARHSLPLRFLIASRPERQIRQSFHEEPLKSLLIKITLDNSKNPDADITLFLRCGLRSIKAQIEELEDDWPSKQDIDTLVNRSSGHFIYASTVLRYISNPRADPKRSLEVVLGLSAPDDTFHNPFAQLDALYSYILDSAFRQQPGSSSTMRQVLGIMTHCADIFPEDQLPFRGLATFSVGFFSLLLFTTRKVVECSLIDLHSILEVPHKRYAKNKPIKFLHASFGEFLSNGLRSGTFYIDPEPLHLHCIKSMSKHAISVIQASDPSRYNSVAVKKILIHGLEGGKCLPSRELRIALHTLIGRSKDKYFQNLEKLGMSAIPRTRTLRQTLSPEDQLTLLTYLQRCNTEEIEASSIRRWLMAVSLAGQIKRTQFLIFPVGYRVLFCTVMAFILILFAIIFGVVYGIYGIGNS